MPDKIIDILGLSRFLDNILNYIKELLGYKQDDLTVPQNLTEPEKAQARENIGVLSSEQVMLLYQDLLDRILNIQKLFLTILDSSKLDNTTLL